MCLSVLSFGLVFFFPPVKKIINPSRSPTLSSHFGCCFLHRENKEFLIGIMVLPPLSLNRTSSELVDVALTPYLKVGMTQDSHTNIRMAPDLSDHLRLPFQLFALRGDGESNPSNR